MSGCHYPIDRVRSLAMLLALLILTVSLRAQNPPQPVEANYEFVVEQNVMITMRDGVKLACDIYRPARNGKAVEEKFPVILERTPYGKQTVESWAHYFVPRGYIAIGQDVRGRYDSEGKWRPFR